MSWSGTVDDAHKLGNKVSVVKRSVTLTMLKKVLVGGIWERQLEPIGSTEQVNIVTTEQWVGIQGTVASDYVNNNTTLSGLQDLTAEPMNDAGAYRITQTTETPGTWA